ncbi:hypothetical protein [Streptomyces phaeofaciens]|nr:hypothetical protein [Streptomyces phaeofaciens]
MNIAAEAALRGDVDQVRKTADQVLDHTLCANLRYLLLNAHT